jgi:uncharacterized protein YbaR (Trm112 family)
VQPPAAQPAPGPTQHLNHRTVLAHFSVAAATSPANITQPHPLSLDHRLIDLLVCPLCKGPLQMGRDANNQPTELRCPADRLGFPIRDGIPVMLESEARVLPVDQGPGAVPSPL